ncbi:hypothetical protein ACJX0J_022363, partial [Zea mays]
KLRIHFSLSFIFSQHMNLLYLFLLAPHWGLLLFLDDPFFLASHSHFAVVMALLSGSIFIDFSEDGFTSHVAYITARQRTACTTPMILMHIIDTMSQIVIQMSHIIFKRSTHIFSTKFSEQINPTKNTGELEFQINYILFIIKGLVQSWFSKHHDFVVIVGNGAGLFILLSEAANGTDPEGFGFTILPIFIIIYKLGNILRIKV